VTRYEPVSPAALVAAVLDLVPDGRLTRLAVDGAPAGEAHELASAVVEAHGRAVHVRAEGFWRPAGQRFEWGREDVDSWLHVWLDDSALEREVLTRAQHGSLLTALRDPGTDRSVRATPVPVPDNGLVVVSGSGLLGRGLPFDAAVHLTASEQALRRRLPDTEQWLVEALSRYDEERAPSEHADLVVRMEDPRHPAVLFRDLSP
jgi:hypothetical protein